MNFDFNLDSILELFAVLGILLDLLPEIIVGLGLGLSYFIVVFAVIRFVEEISELRHKLFNTQSELDLLRDQFPLKRKLIANLKQSLPPLWQRYRNLSQYYGKLRDVQVEADRRQWEEAAALERDLTITIAEHL